MSQEEIQQGEVAFGLRQSTQEGYGTTRFLARINRIFGWAALVLGVLGGVAALLAGAGFLPMLGFVVLGVVALIGSLAVAESLEIILAIEQRQRMTDFRIQELVRLTAGH